MCLPFLYIKQSYFTSESVAQDSRSQIQALWYRHLSLSPKFTVSFNRSSLSIYFPLGLYIAFYLFFIIGPLHYKREVSVTLNFVGISSEGVFSEALKLHVCGRSYEPTAVMVVVENGKSGSFGRNDGVQQQRW